MLIPLKEPWLRWSSSAFPPRQQYDAWYGALNDSHLKWDLAKPLSPQFSGEIEMRNLGGVRLLHCQSSACCGRRTPQEIHQADEAYFGLLLIYEGSELVKSKEKAAMLDKNGLYLWDSTYPMEFALTGSLKKVTMLVPQDQLRSRFPHVDRFVGEKIDVSCGLGALTAAHITALGREAGLIDDSRGNAIVDLTLELIATCLEARQPRPVSKARHDLFEEIKAYIEKNLDDPELGPCAIAANFFISCRYLHLLFADGGISVSNWITQRRLEKCRSELIRTDHIKDNITEIALRWGFNDPAHFSRVFHKYYGLAPRDYQKRHFI